MQESHSDIPPATAGAAEAQPREDGEDIPWTKALHEVLVDLFTPGELERFVFFYLPALRGKIERTDVEEMAFRVIDLAVSQDLVDLKLFIRLEQSADSLELVRGVHEARGAWAREFGVSFPERPLRDPQPTRRISRRRGGRWQRRIGLALVILAAGATGWFFGRQSASTPIEAPGATAVAPHTLAPAFSDDGEAKNMELLEKELAQILSKSSGAVKPPLEYPSTPLDLKGEYFDLHQPMDRAAAEQVLAALPEQQSKEVQELLFILDLHDASGSEDDALRFILRLEAEFADPVVLAPDTVKTMLKSVRATMAEYPPPTTSDDWQYKYRKVEEMLKPVLAVIDSSETCQQRILALPPDVALAAMIRKYSSRYNYHDYNMENRLFDLMTSGRFGRGPLSIVEERLRDSHPTRRTGTSSDALFRSAVRAGRQILGKEFDTWYISIRGVSYVDEMKGPLPDY